MSYQLGIDFGTTHLAAAIRRDDQQVEPVPLGSGGAVVPSALHLGRDGGVTVGDGALRLAGIDAGRVVRTVKRRMGDPAPIVVGGEPWSAEQLSARLVSWVVDRAAEREGGPADGVVLAHPAAWTPATLERLAEALEARDVPATFLRETHAVALAHAAAGGTIGDTVAVYDLGGGHCDVAVLRRTAGASGFTALGRPEGLADVGGLDLDELLIDHVRAALADAGPLDAKTRRACLRAKEVLGTKPEVVVRVRQGELRHDVELDRATFENLITPAVTRTVEALQRTIASAELGADGPATVLLAGGSSRIPLVARMITEALGRPVTIVDDADLVVARGAALADLDAAPDVPVPDAPVLDVRAGADAPPAVDVPADPDVTDTLELAVLMCDATETVELVAPVHRPSTVVAPAPGPPPVAAEPVPSAPAAPAAPAEPAPAVPVRHGASTRPAAVLGGSRAPVHRRSLPRLLVGAGALAAAALVVVALFRPDGPLDPPTHVVGRDASPHQTSAPALPVPPAAVPVPAIEGVRAEVVPDPVRTTAPVRVRPLTDRAPADLPDDDVRPSVDTTRPAPAPRHDAKTEKAAARPVGAATRVPPTPDAPAI